MAKTFWQQLEAKQISKEQVEEFLLAKLGRPNNLTQTNLLTEIIKKINAYYFARYATEIPNTTVFSLIGKIAKASDIIEKQFKEGRRRGQTYYVLEITTAEGTKEKLQAFPEITLTEQLSQIQQLAILGQNLVFKYRKWITNKELLEFYPLPENKAKKRKR